MKINEAPAKALEIFAPDISFRMEQFIERKKKNKRFSHRLNEVMVIQDSFTEHYIMSLANILFNPSRISDEEETLLAWQIRQTYRILNAAIASQDRSLLPFKDKLHTLRGELEMSALLSPLLMDIEEGYTLPDLVCSGHGAWELEKGYTFLPSALSSFTLYTGLGADIASSIGIDIENEQFEPHSVCIKDQISGQIYPFNNEIAPRTYTIFSAEPLPNFHLFSKPGMKARIIETKTGAILHETDSIYLSEILYRFPGRRIHWAACAGVYSAYHPEQDRGPYAYYAWEKPSPREQAVLSDHHKTEKQNKTPFKSYSSLKLFPTKNNDKKRYREMNENQDDEIKHAKQGKK
ncbi:DUF6863 domain-containing protein [Aquicella lusitana]|uniref:Uncharacterized protein n=1 Tax=Aquicella lusitana TaxID=254246 RepID=A0A370GPA1_9COXI|nr:hypothetical protein [Aquicella lusitana]RDI45140.1 hypothetical protein C8D86_10716 [Aquicella lusitana]VVC72790.1 hypothetical protein AQULUS_05140 [Aquicella lusitana]